LMTYTVSRTAWQQYCKEEAAIKARGGVLPESQEHAGEGGHEEEAPLLPKSVFKSRSKVDTFSSVDFCICVSLLACIIISGILRFHMRACEEELGGLSGHGACEHLAMRVFNGHMKEWMRSEGTAWAMQNGIVVLSMSFCLFASAFYGSYTYQVAGWKCSDILMYQAMGVATGLLAGLVGVGGGLIFSPFFLVMGMDPAVAVATSSTCVLFTSSSTTLQYVFTDRVVMSLALVYGLVTMVASHIGTSLVHRLQDTFKGRSSYISAIVAVAVALSAVLALTKFARMVSGVSI